MEKEIVLSKMELKTDKRIKAMQNSSALLRKYFASGYLNFQSFKTIVKHYEPDFNESSLLDFWHFRNTDESVYNVLDKIYEQLNRE